MPACRRGLLALGVSMAPKLFRGPEEKSRSPFLTGKWLLAYYFAMADVFEALAAPARRAILDELHDRDGQTLFELCSRLTMKHGLGLTRQAISQHLDVLEAAGLITTQREGRYKYHFLNTAPLKTIYQRWLKRGRKGAER
jgi:DNA-binding transcriptional ArsR family regulator